MYKHEQPGHFGPGERGSATAEEQDEHEGIRTPSRYC